MRKSMRWLETEEDRERLFRARKYADICAACGRELAATDPVYMEQFTMQAGRRTTPIWGPFGIECISPEFLRQVEGQEAEG